jgi:filamentous hemagglutinin
VLAEHGYDIEQNPCFAGGRNPDYRIEGSIFDNYAPDSGTDIRNIFRVTERKVRKKQTRRVSINLADSSVAPDQLVEQFSMWRIQDLEEVIAIKDGKVYQIFPKPGD